MGKGEGSIASPDIIHPLIFQRTKFLYYLALMDSLSEISAPPLEAWTSSYSALLPFALVTAFYLFISTIIRLLPEVPTFAMEGDVAGSRSGSTEPLISGSEIADENEDVDSEMNTDGIDGAELPGLKRYTHEVEYGHRPWRETLQLLLNPQLSILMFCFLAKRIAFTSENFFPQYASQRFHLDLRHMPWFPWAQALS